MPSDSAFLSSGLQEGPYEASAGSVALRHALQQHFARPLPQLGKNAGCLFRPFRSPGRGSGKNLKKAVDRERAKE